MMLTHGDTAVVRRERMRGHFMAGILELFPLALNLSASFLGARAGLGVLPSPLWGGVGGGGPLADHRTTPTPALRADPPRKGEGRTEFAARADSTSHEFAHVRGSLSVGRRATWCRVKLALRTSTALSQGQPIIAPPGMKRLAQTMSYPCRASATMRSSMGALTGSSAGNIRTNGAVLAAKPVVTAPCTP